MNHPFLEIAARNPGHAGERGRQTEFTHFQNALGIDLPFAPQLQNVFVAGALALLDQPGPQPPNQGVKPEDCLYDHVNRSREVVVPAYVTDFMRGNGIELGVFKVSGDPLGPHQDRSDYAEDSGFDRSARLPYLSPLPYPRSAFHPP